MPGLKQSHRAGFDKISQVSLSIETFVVGPMPNNLYLLVDDEAREVVVIDPSMGSETALQRVEELENAGYTVRAIWNTHGHFDHIYDNAVWKTRFPVPLLMHQGDEFYIDRLREQSFWFNLPEPEQVRPDGWLVDGQILQIGNHEVKVLHTPGHSPGSVSFLLEEVGACISGDVLFRGSVGRTDLPGCSFEELQRSLARLAALPAATKILSGHGDATTIGFELSTNPFLENLPS